MNESASRLIELAWTQSWQVVAVVVAVALVTRLRAVRRRPHLAYALWMLVLAKALTPPLWASPTGAFSWALAERTGPAVETTLDKPALNQPAARISVPAAVSQDTGQSAIPRYVTPSVNQSAEPLNEQPKEIEAAPRSRWNVATVLIAVWVVGGVVYAGVSLGWYWRIRRRLWRRSQEHTLDAAGLVLEVARSFSMRRPPQTIVTECSFGPALIGLWRPALVLPTGILGHLSTDQLRLVVAHELVHLRRGDHWVGLLQFIAQSIWWFNPAVWWANRQTNRVREQCCDEEVLASLRCEPAGYAQTLLDIVRVAPRNGAVALTTGVRAIYVTQNRLEHIMNNEARFHRTAPWVYRLVAILAAIILLPGAGLALEQVTTAPELAQKNDEHQTAEDANSRKDPESPGKDDQNLKQGQKSELRTSQPLSADSLKKQPLDEQQIDYAKVERLSDAIAILKRRLDKLGMSEYSGLLTEESVKRAIRTSINNTRANHAQSARSGLPH